jgi:two-component system phosphate regulon sensor histidine kinase PhoR
VSKEILELLSEGVVVFDENLKIKEINYVAAKLFGLARKKIIGCEIAALANKANIALIEQCRELILSARQEKSIVTDSFSLDKKRIWLDLIATPSTLILQDKSSQYHVLELGKDFVANASHELRTPITIIRGFAETLQDLGEVSSEMLRDITDKILKSCERMDRLVKNLLKLADIENLPLVHRQNCRLDLLLESCRSHLLAAHPKVKIDLEIQRPPPSAIAAKDLLELAIFNLLENSVKYSKPPAHITMALSKKKDCAVISIKDRGIGIPQSDCARIFDKFYTVDKTHSRKLGGAGLGLSIVKTIVDKHEGSISVSSEVGKGSCFTLELPIS